MLFELLRRIWPHVLSPNFGEFFKMFLLCMHTSMHSKCFCSTFNTKTSVIKKLQKIFFCLKFRIAVVALTMDVLNFICKINKSRQILIEHWFSRCRKRDMQSLTNYNWKGRRRLFITDARRNVTRGLDVCEENSIGTA